MKSHMNNIEEWQSSFISYTSVPHENCIYYNSTNHKIIFDTYEGIPQNLILNFIGWLILVILFTFLRKRAGNYGRIALVQKADDNFKWTQLFYGSVDEVIGSHENERHSLSSVDSNAYIDKGIFSWVVAIFTIRKEDIIQKCGPDAVQYLSFQRHIISFMIIMMVLSLTIVLPVNFQGDLEGDETAFGHTTVSNLSPDSSLLWIHVTMAMLYLPLAICIMRRFSIKARIQETRVTTSKTVMIVNIPRKNCDSADLHRHFREAYPELEVRDIQLAFDITKVSDLDREREMVFQARLYCEEFLRRTNTRLDLRPYSCGYVCGCCDIFGCPKVDAIEFYTGEEERLVEAVDVARTTALKHPLGIAFVTFEAVDDAKAFLIDMRRGCQCGTYASASSLSGQLRPERWQVSFAPARSDIFWENLSIPSKHWYIRAIIINIILFVVLFFLTTPAYIVNLVNTVPFSSAIETINPVLSQFVPTLILWTVAALLPVLVSYSDKWLSHWTRSEQNHSIMLKTFVFLLFMVLILPSIGLTSAKAFVDWTWHLQNDTYRWECLFLPDKGAFFVNYVTTSTFIGTALELIRFPELFVYAMQIMLTRSRAEVSSVRKAVLWEFPFGVQYAWMLLIFAMTTMYSLSCPLITPFGLLYMLLKHAVDKHNLFFAYSPSKISSEIHAAAINCVVFSVVLVQASFLGLSILRRGLNDISIFSLIGFVLTILFFFFIVCFSCCKGFSPISYERRHDSSTNASPARPGNSRWFVPDVLNIQNSQIADTSDATRTYGTQDGNVSAEINNRLYQEYRGSIDV